MASWRRRYHPIKDGFVQTYPVAFRFGRGESFPELTRSDVRLEWQTLKPALNYHDIEVVRRTLIDHLSERVVTVEGRTGIPFIVSTKTGKVWAVDDQSGTNDPTWWWRDAWDLWERISNPRTSCCVNRTVTPGRVGRRCANKGWISSPPSSAWCP